VIACPLTLEYMQAVHVACDQMFLRMPSLTTPMCSLTAYIPGYRSLLVDGQRRNLPYVELATSQACTLVRPECAALARISIVAMFIYARTHMDGCCAAPTCLDERRCQASHCRISNAGDSTHNGACFSLHPQVGWATKQAGNGSCA
jgi:hypothetical protein